MPPAQTANLYPEKRIGYYIYKVKHRTDKWLGQRKYPIGFVKSAVFYSFEDTLAWINSLEG
jgi:hypothetical protein